MRSVKEERMPLMQNPGYLICSSSLRPSAVLIIKAFNIKLQLGSWEEIKINEYQSPTIVWLRRGGAHARPRESIYTCREEILEKGISVGRVFVFEILETNDKNHACQPQVTEDEEFVYIPLCCSQTTGNLYKCSRNRGIWTRTRVHQLFSNSGIKEKPRSLCNQILQFPMTLYYAWRLHGLAGCFGSLRSNCACIGWVCIFCTCPVILLVLCVTGKLTDDGPITNITDHPTTPRE